MTDGAHAPGDPGDRRGALLVLVAVDFEARGLARRLHLPPASLRTRDGRLTLRTIGLGAATLSRLTPDLPAGRPAMVLVAGVAGACAPELAPGTIVVGNPVGPTASGEWLTPEGALVDRAVRALQRAEIPYRVGRLATTSVVAATPEVKATLWRTHDALGVDMESAHALAWAAAAGIPALAVRAIADGPRESLPPALARVVRSDGGVRPGAALGLCWPPALLGASWRMWRRSRLALDRLARFLAAFAACGS